VKRLAHVWLALVAVTLLCAGSALAAGHLNAYSIEGQFFCVSCHEPLNQVNSPEAQSEKTELHTLVNRGLDIKQIKADMVSYYGPNVLSEPPAHGFNLLLYVLPPVVLIAGLGAIAYSLPRWRRRAVAQARGQTASPVVSLDPEDARRLDAELDDFDA
jgi:cytochrome c-type biogenesis protein CcmH/NrfF